MQLTIYELVILNSMNIEVYRYQSDNRKEVENKIEELKDDSGEYTEIPADLETKLQVEKLKLNGTKKKLEINLSHLAMREVLVLLK